MKERDLEIFIDFCKSVYLKGNKAAFNVTSYQSICKLTIDEYGVDLGVQNHKGHIAKLFYLFYDFYLNNKIYLEKRLFVPLQPSEEKELMDSLREYLSSRTHDCNEYKVNDLRKNLPIVLGGSANDGGRWSPTFKRLAPLVQYYLMS